MNAILVIGPAWIGDMVMAQSLLRQLKQSYPDASIDVIVPRWCLGLLARMPEVREAIELPFAHGQFKPIARYQFGQALQVKAYDWAIVLPYTWKSALVPLGANIPKRTGFVGEQRWGLLNDIRRLNKRILPMMVQRYVALGQPISTESPKNFPYPQLSSNATLQQTTRQRLQLPIDSERVLGLCPGAEYGPAKRWPAQYFAKLAIEKIQQGWQVWILGSAKDEAVASQINATTDHQCVNLAGKTSMTEVIDLLALCQVVVSNDSGLMHIAAAVNTPVVAVFGSSNRHYTPPLTVRSQVISVNKSCSPCFKKTCQYQHYACLTEISVNQIATAVSQLRDDVNSIS